MQSESSGPAKCQVILDKEKLIQGFTTDFVFSDKHQFVLLTKYPVGGKVKAFHT